MPGTKKNLSAEGPTRGVVAAGKRKASAQREDSDSEGTSAPAAKLVKTAAPAGGEDVSGKIKWLVSLTDADAIALRDVMIAQLSSSIKNTTAEPDYSRLSSLRGDPRDGRWYLQWAEHRVVSSTDSGHPRLQIKMSTLSSSSVAGKIKSALSPGAWGGLQALVDPASKTQALKFQAHHVSYNASSMRGPSPLLQNLGKGSSVSHLCNTSGCIEASHLKIEAAHRDNMDRQRCRGVLLLVFRDQILQDRPCSHAVDNGAVGGTILTRLQSSCRKIMIVEVDEQAATSIASMLFE